MVRFLTYIGMLEDWACCLVGYEAVCSGTSLPAFRSNILPP
jgi:hypothetical protein